MHRVFELEDEVKKLKAGQQMAEKVHEEEKQIEPPEEGKKEQSTNPPEAKDPTKEDHKGKTEEVEESEEQRLKREKKAKVSISFQSEVAVTDKEVYILGEFNKWKPEKMDSIDEYTYSKDLILEQGFKYRYQLLVLDEIVLDLNKECSENQLGMITNLIFVPKEEFEQQPDLIIGNELPAPGGLNPLVHMPSYVHPLSKLI